MAAGAYKGLTIKLGADTSALTAGLRAVNSASYKTQQELNKLNKAAKINPGNVNIVTQQMGALSAQVVNAAEKMNALSQSVDAIGGMKAAKTKNFSGTIAELAKNTASATLEAEKAKAAYNKVDGALEAIYKKVKKEHGINIRDITNSGQWNDKKLTEVTEKIGPDNAEKIRRLKEEWVEARNALDNYTDVAKFNALNDDLTIQEAELNKINRQLAEVDQYGSSAFSDLSEMLQPVNERLALVTAASEVASERFTRLDNALKLDPTNMDLIEQRSRAMAETMVVAETKAESLRERLSLYEAVGIDKTAASFDSIALEVEKSEMAFNAARQRLAEFSREGSTSSSEFQKLKQNLDAAQERMDTAHACAQWEKLRTELFDVNGEIVDLARSMADIHAPSTVMQSYAELASRVKDIQSALQSTSSNFQGLENAIKLNPDNVLAVDAAMEQLKEQERLAKEEAAGLREELSHYDTDAINAAANFDVSATTQLHQASEEFLKTDEACRKLKAGIAETEIELEKLGAKKVWDESDLQAATNYEEALSAMRALLPELEGNLAAAKEQLDLSKGRAEVSELNVKLALSEENADKVYVAMQRLKDVKFAPDIDVDGLKQGAKDIEESLKSLTSGSGGKAEILGDLKPQYDLLSTALKSARERASELGSALKLDPTNMQIAALYANALEESQRLASAKAELLKTAIAGIPSGTLNSAAISSGTIGTKLAQSAAKATEASKRINTLTKQIEATKKEIDGLPEITSKTHPEKIDQLNSKLEELQSELEEANRDAENAFADLRVDSATSACQQLQVELARDSAEAEDFGQRARRAMGEAGDAADDAGNKVSTSTEKWSAAAVQAADRVGDAIRRAAQNVIDTSVDIDSAYRDMRKTVDDSEENYQRLYDSAMKYSQTHVTSAKDMLEMEAIAGQLGVGLEGGATAIEHFAEVAANLDVATNIDAESIALQMGQIVNVMQDLSNEDPSSITGFADALVRLGNTMPTQESNIMQITQRLSAVGNVAGFTTPELMGWSAAIASTGQKSEAAATGISTIITRISSAVSIGGRDIETMTEDVNSAIAKGGDALKDYASAAGMSAKDFVSAWKTEPTEVLNKLQKSAEAGVEQYAKVAGKSVQEFIEAWRVDPSGTLREVIKGLKDSGDDLFATLSGMDVNSVRQTQTLASLSQTVETVDRAIDSAKDAFEGGGDAEREAMKKAEGLSGSMSKLQNSLDALKASFGDAMVPIINAFTKVIQSINTVLNSLGGGAKTAIVAISGIAGIVGTATPVLYALYEGWQKVVGGFVKAGSLEKAKTVVVGLGKALGGLATSGSIFLGIFGAIGAITLGAFIKELWNAHKRAKTFDDTVGGVMGSLDGLNEQLRLGGDYVSDYGGAYKDAMEDYNDFIESIQQHNKNIKDTRDETGESIAMLERYKQIIDEAAGAGEDYAGSYGELKWAVDGLNEMLGTSYDVNDVLAGKYKDEAGEVHNLRDEVDKLIESKKRELQLAAMGDIYTETYKAYKEAQIETEKAQRAIDDYMAERREQLAGSTTRDNWTGKLRERTQAEIDSLIRSEDAYKDLEAARDTSVATLNEEEEALGIVTDAYDGYARAAYDASTSMGVREGFMRTNMDFVAAAEAVGKSGDELTVFAKTLAKRVEECGVSTDDFANMMPLLADKVRETGGDMQSLIEWCVEYNSQEFPDKYINVHFDEDGNLRNAENQIVEWNDEAKNFVPVEIKGDATQLMVAEETARNAVENGEAIKVPMEVDEASAQASAEQAKANAASDPVEFDAEVDGSQVQGEIDAATEGAEANVDITADGSQAQQEIQETTSAISDAEVKVVVSADTTAAQSVIDALAKIPSEVVTNIVVRGSKLGGIADNIQRVNSAASKMSSVKAKYTASGNAATDATVSTKIDRVAKAGASMRSNTVNYNAYGNIVNSDTAVNRVWNMVNAVSRLQSKSITLTTTQKTVKKTVSAPAGAGESATGAYIPYNKIPKHAAGIFTRPTLTNIGWVGEDGAELYSGNSLVPLTNRKYSMPYINDISDAVARKIGGTGTQYNVYIDGARVNDDPAIQAAFLGLFDVLQRKGAMNRG